MGGKTKKQKEEEKKIENIKNLIVKNLKEEAIKLKDVTETKEILTKEESTEEEIKEHRKTFISKFKMNQEEKEAIDDEEDDEIWEKALTQVITEQTAEKEEAKETKPKENEKIPKKQTCHSPPSSHTSTSTGGSTSSSSTITSSSYSTSSSSGSSSRTSGPSHPIPSRGSISGTSVPPIPSPHSPSSPRISVPSHPIPSSGSSSRSSVPPIPSTPSPTRSRSSSTTSTSGAPTSLVDEVSNTLSGIAQRIERIEDAGQDWEEPFSEFMPPICLALQNQSTNFVNCWNVNNPSNFPLKYAQNKFSVNNSDQLGKWESLVNEGFKVVECLQRACEILQYLDGCQQGLIPYTHLKQEEITETIEQSLQQVKKCEQQLLLLCEEYASKPASKQESNNFLVISKALITLYHPTQQVGS